MSLSILWWVLFVVGVCIYGYGAAVPAWPGARFGGLLSVVLIGLLGYAVFGFHLGR